MPDGSASSADSTLSRIETLVRQELDAISAEEFRELVRAEYRLCRLLDDDGRWATERLARADAALLPGALSVDGAASRFLAEMVRHVAANGYLMRFLRTATPRSAPRIVATFSAQKQRIVPVAVAYAFILQQLTALVRRDYEVSDDLVRTLRARRSGLTLHVHLSPFAVLKLYSLEPLVARFAERARRRNPRDWVRRTSLPFNILEATAADALHRRWGNARAGWILAVHAARRGYPASTGAGRIRPSDDGGASTQQMPFPVRWNDLYTTWNMAFASTLGELPFMVAKLLIPQVHDYAERPGEYMHNRAVALYVHLHRMLFFRAEHGFYGDWSDPVLFDAWGRANRESAEHYRRLVKRGSNDPSVARREMKLRG